MEPSSRFERNVLAQPELLEAILEGPLPSWMPELRRKRALFVGVGSSYHAAQITKCFWRRAVSPQAEAVHSFDFAKLPQPVGKGDLAVLLSHRASKSYTVDAAKIAREAGASTVGVTMKGGHWTANLDHRLETCEREDTGAFTKSVTTTLAWLAAWTGDAKLKAGLVAALPALHEGPYFPNVRPESDVVLIGDLEREWVARETALKLWEAAYLRARAFGLEEFLHGPQISVSPQTVVVAFSDQAEKRWDAARAFLKVVGVPLVEVDFPAVPREGRWLAQIFWGQRFTAAACRQLGLDPDACRSDDPRFKKAAESLAG